MCYLIDYLYKISESSENIKENTKYIDKQNNP